MAQNQQVMQATWFLVGCVLFAVASVASIIIGAVTHATLAIVIGAIVLIASAILFASGMVDRKHALRHGTT